MPSGPRYERLPLEEESEPHYFPTAPPSFRTIPLDQDQQSITPSLPHRHDENAATVMPLSERPTAEIDDPPISLWGASESTTTRENVSRDDILIKLLDAVERLEERLDGSKDETTIKAELDLEASRQDQREAQRQQRTKEILGAIGGIVFTIIFLVWLGAIIIIPAVAKYKYAGAIAAAAAAALPTSTQG